MINILLICSAGMSTSMLVAKMQKASQEQNIETTIWAVGDAEKSENIGKADVVMLGPQVRYMKKTVEDIVKGEKPVLVIDMADYGMMNGPKVLNTAIKSLEAK